MSTKIKSVVFPRDHQAHNTSIEWWYFNGHLWDKQGNRYGFMNCLFRVDLKQMKVPFLKNTSFRGIPVITRFYNFAHSIVTDVAKQKTYKEVQNVSFLSRDSFKKNRLYVSYIDPIILHGFSSCEIAETAEHEFVMKTGQLDLHLDSQKKPMMESGKGFIKVCGRTSYYYSLTDLKVKGQIKVGDKWVEVEGKGWMDHQWSDENHGLDKWSWFSVQLDNGQDVMCVEYEREADKTFLVDVINGKNKQEHFQNLILVPGKEIWQSSRTRAKYPLSWLIEIPEKKMKLQVKALIKDQEMLYGTINYWEGPLEVSGTVAGKKVRGVGYMELVGYPADFSMLKLIADKLTKTIAGGLQKTQQWIWKKVYSRSTRK